MRAENRPETIDAYLHDQPEAVRLIFEKLREIIHQAAPGAEEKISYGIPAFRLDGRYLIYCAAFKNHISLYPRTVGVETEFGDELKPYASGKGTLQFPLKEPLPYDLIQRVVECRVREHRAAAGKAKPRKAGG